ncbi:MAG TPA: SH3 domain-containing protein [Thermomicrobiales bacterium]
MATRRWRTGWAESGAIRLISALIVLAALVAGLAQRGTDQVRAAEFVAGDLLVVDTDGLNLRAGAGLSFRVIEVLPGGAAVTVTTGPRTADGYDWYRVRTDDGATGWVAGKYLAWVNWGPYFAAGDLAVVDTLRLNCRSGPGLDYAVVYVMDGGTEVTILDGPSPSEGYHWYKVETDDGDVGWVIGEGLAPGSDDSGATPDFAKGEDVVVDTARLNLRVGAGLDQTVVDVLPGGTALIVSNGPMAADGYDWYEVETRDGRLGWVAGAFLAHGSVGDFAVGDAVRVAGGRLNLRAEPSLSAEVLRVLADNEVLVVLDGPFEADGYSWYRVRNDGSAGWAAGEYLRFEPNGFPPEEGG